MPPPDLPCPSALLRPSDASRSPFLSLTLSLSLSLSLTHTLFSSDHLILSSKRTTNPVGYRMLLLLFVSCFSHSILLLVLLTPFVFLPLLSLCPSQTSSLVLLPSLRSSCSPIEGREKRTKRVAHGTGILARFVSSMLSLHAKLYPKRFFGTLPLFFHGIFVDDHSLSLPRFVSSRFLFFSFASTRSRTVHLGRSLVSPYRNLPLPRDATCP